MSQQRPGTHHIVLTSHPNHFGPKPPAIQWGGKDALERGPVIATVANAAHRNSIGTHSGSYAIYRALAIATGSLQSLHKPDLTNTAPAEKIGPFDSWFDADKIVSLDPWGALVSDAYKDFLEKGYDIRPTIAVTKAHIHMPEIADAVLKGRLKPDGNIVTEEGICSVTKAAIEPVWYLPGVAKRCGIDEGILRRTLFEQTGGMFPELITRPDISMFLPPIGGYSIYIFGELSAIDDPKKPIAVRIHDECNGSDVFGSDICTCRPYLTHGIEVCAQAAQEGGLGVIVYCRKEGRALGEVTKFLVYNARKRQEGGDRAEKYFARTECVAGVQDMRFQELMPDVLHWLGIKRIDRLVSMSNMKFNAIVNSGIVVHDRFEIPDDLIPADAQVEMDAKKAAGYFTDHIPDDIELKKKKGREL
ncbi:MAG: GTP cyclohydrolase II [Silvanigrellaceae bacterium]